MNKRLIVLLIGLFAGRSYAQNTIDSVLSKIALNNKDLAAVNKRLEALRMGYKTGLTLYDPQVSYDYLKGYPATAGSQNDLSIVQAFDFPTVYGNRKKVSMLKIDQTRFESQSAKREILLKAKLISIQLVYLNKRKIDLQQRLAQANEFYSDYQKKFDRQDATVLDINKAKLQLINLQTAFKLLETERIQVNQQLTELNANIPVDFKDTVYPSVPALPDFETLEQNIEVGDPVLKYYQAQQQIGEAEIKLNRSLSLPKMELGYHYQGILGQRFHGAHIGFSVPLWENRNKVKYQQLQTSFFDAQISAHRIEHFSYVKQLFDKFKELQIGLEDYRKTLQLLNNNELLKKALNTGQISTLEYYLEITLLYESRDRYLQLEYETARALAELLKFEL